MKGFIEIVSIFAAIIASALLLTTTITPTTNSNDLVQTTQLFESYSINLQKAAFYCDWTNQALLTICVNNYSSTLLSELNNGNYNCSNSLKQINNLGTDRNVIITLDCNKIYLKSTIKTLNVRKDVVITKKKVFDGLVFYLKMDNDMNDYSGHNITPITNTGTKTTGISGITSSATSYTNSTEYTKYSASSDLNTKTQITITAWIYPQGSSVEPLIEYNNSTTFGLHLWQWDTGTKLYANQPGGSGLMTSANTISQNTWQQVALTYDGTTARLYVNGVEKINGNPGWTNLKTDYNIYIAKRPAGLDSDKTPNLKIDEVMIWNRSLNSTDINYIYQSQRKKI